MQAGSQLLRRHESFSVAFHASVLLVPATFAILYGTCRAGTNPLTFFIAYLTSLVAWTVLYRISPVHPLAQYPGPFWCKTSKLWWGLLVMRGYSHYRLRALHEQYGDVIRIGAFSHPGSIISNIAPFRSQRTLHTQSRHDFATPRYIGGAQESGYAVPNYSIAPPISFLT